MRMSSASGFPMGHTDRCARRRGFYLSSCFPRAVRCPPIFRNGAYRDALTSSSSLSIFTKQCWVVKCVSTLPNLTLLVKIRSEDYSVSAWKTCRMLIRQYLIVN
jgi:hypothetical protein